MERQRFIDGYGYVLVLYPEHHLAMKSGYLLEHRLVAEEKLGRLLSRNEDVHHVNGNKADNRPGNLEVLTHSEHISRSNSEHPRNGKRGPTLLLRMYCIHGHEYTSENTGFRASRGRTCRRCLMCKREGLRQYGKLRRQREKERSI